MLIIVFFYTSKYNIVVNLEQSRTTAKISSEKISIPQKGATLPKSERSASFSWDHVQSAWYEKQWTKSHIVDLPVKKQNGHNPSFKNIKNSVTKYHQPVDAYHFGMDWMHNSAITAGDINHDGLMDLILSKIDMPIRVFMNKGNNTFSDVTNELFGNAIPSDVEQISLADFNNDSWLDLLVVFNRYDRAELNHKIYFFDPDIKKFNETFELKQQKVSTSGNIALYDLNHDGILDIYLANSRNWRTPRQNRHGFLKSSGIADQLWISTGGIWKEESEKYMNIVTEEYAGMPALFTDLDTDGKVDFLLGNDSQPDVTMMGTSDGLFKLIDKNKIVYNTENSMSYFTLDVDNDGVFEIWENGIAFAANINRNRTHDVISQPSNKDDHFSKNLKQLQNNFGRGELHCDAFFGLLHIICQQKKALYFGVRLYDEKECDAIVNPSEKEICGHLATRRSFLNRADPRKFKYKAEHFPKKISHNILLKKDQLGRYGNILHNKDASLTGWSWAAYPYDIDNNGFLDLYVTTGAIHTLSRMPNALLMNDSEAGVLHLQNRAALYGVDTLAGSRGCIIADFDQDGDGDIVVNTMYTSPVYYENQSGGNSISISLRSRSGNYYALGSRLELHTSRGIQTREVRVGGIWNSFQPSEQNFGLAEKESIKFLKIIWPDNHSQIVKKLEANHRYCIYE